MSTTDTVISLPYSDLTSVTFKSNETINFSSINDKLVKLLENDKYIFDLKNSINNIAVVDYEYLSATRIREDESKMTWTISPTDLVWNYNYDNESIVPSISANEHINILFPIIPTPAYIVNNIGWEAPTKVPAAAVFELKDEQLNNKFNTYDDILEYSYLNHLNIKNGEETEQTSGNVVRYEAAYFASLNRHSYFTELYNKGYRWAEMLMSEDAIKYLFKVSNNIQIPYLNFISINDVSSSVEDTFDLIKNTTLNQYILNDSESKLMNSYVNGTWSRKCGSGMKEIGGIIQLIPNGNEFNVSSITFDKPFDMCLNVTLNVYNCVNAADSTKSPEKLMTSPIYITNIREDGFDFKVKPDYMNNNNEFNSQKTLTEYNIIWKAKGITNE